MELVPKFGASSSSSSPSYKVEYTFQKKVNNFFQNRINLSWAGFLDFFLEHYFLSIFHLQIYENWKSENQSKQSKNEPKKLFQRA